MRYLLYDKSFSWFKSWSVVSFVSVCSLICLSSQMYLSDLPLTLPPYERNGLTIGVEGEVHAEIKFEGGKARQVRVSKSDLTIPEHYPFTRTSVVAAIRDNITRITTEPLTLWKSYALETYTKDVIIELKVDPRLRDDQRRYELELDLTDGVPERITIWGGRSQH